ncbi:MAG TPA: DUF1259 domain-containing protein [Allosphingosinicella sp.]|nr:DUF1259 domain-containing protein [Allosphingosinicella sp.]
MRAVLIALALAASLPLAAPAGAAAPWEETIAAGLGRSGTEMPGGVYRVGLPRSDLHVVLDGVTLKPALALGSWVAFARHGSGNEVMVMGDLVLTDEEVNPVMARLIEGGFEITALHNHLLRSTPHTMYMHVGAHGDPARLAHVLHEALSRSGTPLTQPAAAPAAPAPLDLDIALLDHLLGARGKANGGVYAFTIPRAQAPHAGGMAIPPALGTGIAINFQPTGGGRAAITGDFVLTASEVNPVLRALRAHGIEVTALHNHMLDDEPRLFFMHFWANDDAGRLATGLAEALRHVAVAHATPAR